MTEQEKDKLLCNLFPKQRRVVLMVLDGKTNEEISKELGVSVGSVSCYMTPVYKLVGIVGNFGGRNKRRKFLEMMGKPSPSSDAPKSLPYITPAPKKEITSSPTPTPAPHSVPPAALGTVDIVTPIALAIIKEVSGWKEGVGELVIFEKYFPNRAKYLYLFGEASSDVQMLINNACADIKIQVRFKSCLK